MFQDLRYGVRMLRTHPGFTAVAVVTLALGIGANTAIFTLLDKLLIRTLPVEQPHQLVAFVSDAERRARDFLVPAVRQPARPATTCCPGWPPSSSGPSP